MKGVTQGKKLAQNNKEAHTSLNNTHGSTASKFDTEVLYIDGVPLAQTKAILRLDGVCTWLKVI